MRREIVVVALGIIAAAAGVAGAVDHGNLDEGRPVRLEDAYPIAHGEISIETAPDLRSSSTGPTAASFRSKSCTGRSRICR